MTLYYIDEALRNLLDAAIDPETGEVKEDEDLWAELDRLQLTREEVIEQMGLEYKNLDAEAEACRKEARALTERARRLECRRETIKGQLATALDGEKFSTGRVAFTFRRVTTGEVTDRAVFMDWAENGHKIYLRYKEPEIDKLQLTNALKAGVEVPGAELQTRKSMSIK